MKTVISRLLCSMVITGCLLMSNASAQSNQDVRKYTNLKYMVWQIHEGNSEKAIELCEKGLERKPHDLEPLFQVPYGLTASDRKVLGDFIAADTPFRVFKGIHKLLGADMGIAIYFFHLKPPGMKRASTGLHNCY